MKAPIGIWVQDLSRAANLHKQVTSKIVTKLMNKNSFKQVKVVKVRYLKSSYVE